MTKTLTRVYSDHTAADRAVMRLKEAGLRDSDISIVASDAEGWHRPGGSDVDPKHDKDRDGKDDRAEGAATGGGLGAVAGAAAGAATGLGLLAIPGVGPVVAAGWLATAVAGAAAGGVGGGIIGALVESGTSEKNATLYAEALRRGGAIVTARVPDDEEHRYASLMDQTAWDITKLETAYRASGWRGYDPSAPSYTPDEIRRERDAYRP
ncbi:MAG TPA: hypothetical protein VG798_00980 [Rhizomicrobium sp.]|nr:hypothetical protein [Rhizomicrobium sp.]